MVLPGYPGAAMAAAVPGVMPMGMPGMLPGMPGMPMPMAAPMGGGVDPGTKTMRELFVGNTPPGTTQAHLIEFLNAALKQVNLTTSPGDPIIQCRVSEKFAFVELRSIEETNAMLSVTGIPYNGNMLKIGRPSKYVGPMVASSNWQALTGTMADPGVSGVDPNTKIYRELFVGNTMPEMNEVELQEFLGAAMAQVGLAMKEGNPILSTRLNGKFAFIELRSIEETNAALNLNGIPYLGSNLRIGRPSKYNGPVVPTMEWNEVLQKYLAGEMPNMATQAAAAAPAAAVPAAAATKCIKLGNMVTAADVADPTEHAEIVEDTKDECSKFGQVMAVTIPRGGEAGSGFVFVVFAAEDQAAAAAVALGGRTFDGKRVEASFYSETLFASGDFSA